MQNEIRVPDLATATGQDLVDFLVDNRQVVAEVGRHVENLTKLGGTSQAHALGYQAYLGDDFNLEDFTKHLSKQGYAMSMESLSSVLLVAASATVVVGVGYIAYKLIKAALTKQPKSNEVLSKVKQVEQMVSLMSRLDLTDQPAEFQELFKTHVLTHCVKEAIDYAGPQDLLTRAYDAFVINRLIEIQTPTLSTRLIGLPGSSYVIYGAGTYLESIKLSLENFRSQFLNVVVNMTEANPAELIQLINGIDWNQAANRSDAGWRGIEKWVTDVGALEANRASSLALTAIKDAVQDILLVPASAEDFARIDMTKANLIDPPSKDKYDRFYDSLTELKDLGNKIKASAEHYKKNAKMDKLALGVFEQQVQSADTLVDMIGVVEFLVRAESDAAAKLIQGFVEGGQAFHGAIVDCAKAMKDQGAAEKVLRELREVVKITQKFFGNMSMESLYEPRLPRLNEVMALEGRNQALDFLKAIGFALLIGLAVGVIYSAVMSMLGIASFQAAWKGGMTYILKDGRRVTKSEAGDKLIENLKKHGVAQFGVNTINTGKKVPFAVTNAMINETCGAMESGVRNGMLAFSRKLDLTEDKERLAQSLIAASNEAVKYLESPLKTVLQSFRRMGVNLDDISPESEDALHQARERVREFVAEWFNSANVKFDETRYNFSTFAWKSYAEDAPNLIDKHAEKIVADLEKFGSNIRTVNKETLQGLGEEARKAHKRFELHLSYMTLLAGLQISLIKGAISDSLKAFKAWSETFKMAGESFSAIQPMEHDTAFDYVDPMDTMLDQLGEAAALSRDEQVTMVQENWSNVVKTGVMVVGVLALLGVGAVILKSLLTGKGSTDKGAKKEHFDKVDSELEMANAMSDMADAMIKNIEQAQRNVDSWNKSVEDKNRTVHTQSSAESVPPQVIEHDPTASKQKAAPAVAGGDDDLSANLAKMEEMAQALDKAHFLQRLEELLIQNPPSRVGMNAITGGDNDEMLQALMSDAQVDAQLGPLNELVNDILKPVEEALSRSDYEAELDRISATVTPALEKFVKENEQSLHADGVMEAANRELDEELAPMPVEEIRGLAARLKPLDTDFKKLYSQYDAVGHAIDKVLDKIQRFITQVEQSPASGAKVTERLESIRGNRSPGSILLRRIEEVKPIFHAVAKGMKIGVRMAQGAREGIERALKVYHQICGEQARQAKAGRAQLEAILRNVEARDNVPGDLREAIDDIKEQQDKIMEAVNKAGL